MQVRIQLIRDDGSVVMDATHNAEARFVWNVTHIPLAQIVIDPGVRLAGFLYEPSILYDVDEILAKPSVLVWQGKTFIHHGPTLASSEPTE